MVIRAARGGKLTCKGWKQEAALRMLMNSLDPEVAQRPADLVVYGGTEKAARDWPSFHAIVRELETLGNDETLLVDSGKLVEVFRTHEEAPRVLIANANLVGSWMYIGCQGILQGAYETFAAARKYFGGSLAGKLVVSGGMGGVGGAQPLAATMNGATFLGIEVDPERIKRRVKTGYCDYLVTDFNEAVRILRSAVHQQRAVSVGLVGNCAEVLPEMVRRGIVPDLLTDQTSAHDPLNGYLPAGLTVESAAALRAASPEEYRERSMDSIAGQARATLELQQQGARAFDYGNDLGPLLAEGGGPLRWVALSGEASDIAATDAAVRRMFPENEALGRWIGLAGRLVRFQGLPARVCRLGHGERARFAVEINRMVAEGELKAPMVMGRDHLDGGPVALADRPLLDALLNTAAGSSWVSVHNGGGVGMGYSQLAGQVAVADGSEQAGRDVERVMSWEAGLRAP